MEKHLCSRRLNLEVTLLRKILAAALCPFFLLTAVLHSEGWSHVGGDAGGSRYSSLKQITKEKRDPTPGCLGA